MGEGKLRIAVLGPGLLGGSIVRALQHRKIPSEVRIWGRRKPAVEEVANAGDVHIASTDVSAVVDGADLTVLATPVEVMASVLEGAIGSLKKGSVVTDVGSVKGRVVAELTPIAASAGAVFVGSHPMAGSEVGGFTNADPCLFEGAPCLVTPLGDTAAAAVDQVSRFWTKLGCHVAKLSPGRHDEVVGRISHLPHAVASAVAVVALADEPEIAVFSGGGFRDTTRIAAGDPSLWNGILGENSAVVASLLRKTAAQLESVAGALDSGDGTGVFRFLDRAHKLRQSCPPRPVKAE